MAGFLVVLLLIRYNNNEGEGASGRRNGMTLSSLQRYILRTCYLERRKLSRQKLLAFYSVGKKIPSLKDQIDSITKSLERLIARGLMVGLGEKTAERFFIREIRLTPVGRRIAKTLFGNQQKLI